MKLDIRKIGNSRGIILPRPMLEQCALKDKVEVEVVNETIVIRKSRLAPRTGWEEECKCLAGAEEDMLVWPEFANEADAEWQW